MIFITQSLLGRDKIITDWYNTKMLEVHPGLIIIMGSGETQPSSSKTHEFVARSLPENPRLAILETPAGFELNSDKVAGRIKTFLERRLQNFGPRIDLIAARKRGTRYSPDNPEIVDPLYAADEILLGPGSPTYCTRQLKDSLAYHILRSRHRLGAAILLSSAATVSFGAYAIPVYEIYKVGEDPYWVRGLNFFSDFGMNLAIVPHWNNRDGGEELDTSHCFIGEQRFNVLRQMLPADVTILGIDDHTSLVIDLEFGRGQVFGNDGVHILAGDQKKTYRKRDQFPLTLLGEIRIPQGEGIPENIWQEARQRQLELEDSPGEGATPPDDVLALVAERENAREKQDWHNADALRDRIHSLGWQVMDTQEGPKLSKYQVA